MFVPLLFVKPGAGTMGWVAIVATVGDSGVVMINAVEFLAVDDGGHVSGAWGTVDVIGCGFRPAIAKQYLPLAGTGIPWLDPAPANIALSALSPAVFGANKAGYFRAFHKMGVGEMTMSNPKWVLIGASPPIEMALVKFSQFGRGIKASM